MFHTYIQRGLICLVLLPCLTGSFAGWGLSTGDWCSSSFAGEFNETISIGDSAPSLNSLIDLEGKEFNSTFLQNDSIIVIAFTCNTCPYANDYEARLSELVAEYKKAQKPVQFIAINSNDIPGDSLTAMKERSDKMQYPFTYWKDSSQQVAKQFGATKTPEFYILNRDKKIVYMGAFDDNTDPTKVKVRFLQQAIDATLADQKVEQPETPPVGCRIRVKRERR